jgi:hypothetical protein
VAPQSVDGLYQASASRVDLVEVPAIQFLMLDGRGDPNTSAAYRDAIEALYALSYGLKFALKKDAGFEYRVGPLEGLWWAEDMTTFSVGRKADWSWTMMVAQPDVVTPERFAAVRVAAERKKALPALPMVRLERFEEGLCAQLLHVGPFSAEGPTIERLHTFIREHGYHFDGRQQKHHEIYLSDIRRAAVAKWRTIIRQPIVPA